MRGLPSRSAAMQASWAACPCCLGPVQHRIGIYLNKGAKTGCSRRNRARSASGGLGHFPGPQKESGCKEQSHFGDAGLSPDLFQCQGVILRPLWALQRCREASSPSQPSVREPEGAGVRGGSLGGTFRASLASCLDRLRIWDEGCWGQ